MWLQGFQAFFDVKLKLELLVIKAKRNGNEISKLDFSMNKNHLLPSGTPMSGNTDREPPSIVG